MSSSAAGYAARGGRRSARRKAPKRHRLLLVLVALGATAAAIALYVTPLARRAINDLSLPLAHASIIRQQAAAKHLGPALIAAVIYAESKFDPRPSSAGAEGLMQLLPGTAEYLAQRSGGTSFQVSDLATPQVNIAYGSYYLRELLDHYHGAVPLALAAYNAGQTNVDRWVAEARAHGHSLTITQIPFAETRLYVEKVLQARKEYRRVYASQLGY